MINALGDTICADIEALIKTWIDGGGVGFFKLCPGGIWRREEQDGSLLKEIWEVRLAEEKGCHDSQGPDKAGKESDDEEDARLPPNDTRN